jgi:hypothetical protein
MAFLLCLPAVVSVLQEDGGFLLQNKGEIK